MAENIILEGGKGGGGSSFSEKDNTLRSNTYVATLEALGYGLQLGPVDGLKSVYLDDTPLYAADGTANFSDVKVDFRTGTPSQAVIKGFEETGAPITVATDCVCPAGVPTPVTRTVSSSTVDAVAVTIRLPQGLSVQDTGNNTLAATVLEFDIKTKLTSSGTWANAIPRVRYNDKTTSAYEESFRIERPAGTGTWDIRIERVTPDSTSATVKNTLNWAYFTEYDHEVITYPNVGLMGITLNASGVNATRVPTRSVDWYGRIIQVPNVFNPQTRTYSGVWDLSTFQNKWCNDPAWVLYDLATDTTVGLGLDPSEIDVASFYEASIYNSAQVSYTGTDGIVYTGPRYSFNAPVTEASTGIDWLKRIAATMNATVLWVNGQLTLVQDRPDTFKHVFTNANVVDGRFTRSGTPDDTRYTVCNVTWNAPADGYKQRVTSVEDTAGIASYGFLETNVAAFGCTSMSQAVRFGKWILDSSLYTTTTISFTTGEIGAVVIPGDVIRVYDNTYAGYDAAGRLLSGSTTTVLNLDRPVSLSADATITIWGQDGTLYTDVAITTTGTASTITLTTPLAAAPAEGSIFQITTNSISPELYRVIDREETEDGKFTITAGQYDANKWSRIEGGVVLATPRYTAMAGAVVQPPTALTFNERSVYVDLTVQRKLHITWTPVANQVVSGYRVTYTMNGGNKVVTDVKIPGIEIDVQTGLVLVTVQSLSYKGIPSRSLDGTYTVLATETTGSVLNAPTSLGVYPGGGTTFTTRDLIVQWTNPTTNGATTQGVVRFKVEVYNGATLLRSDYVDAVAPGLVQTYSYPFDANIADGGPRRSVTIKVYCQDASRKLSGAATATFTNAAPAAPSSLVVSGSVGQLFVTNTLPTDNDYKGTLVWASLTTGFTPSSANLVYDGSDNFITVKALGAGVHYLKVAHYDTFGKDFAGTGLNLSAQQSATPLANAGIQSGSANPATGNEGDLFYNTTDGKLYRWHGGWTAAVPTADLTGLISGAQIAPANIDATKFAAGIEPVSIVSSIPGSKTTYSIFNSADGKLYRWFGGAYVATNATADLTGTITTTQITDSAVTTAKVASNAITTNKLLVTSQGQNLNADPMMTDVTAWAGSSTPVLLSGITDLPVGGSTAMSSQTNVQTVVISTDYIPLDANFNYRVEAIAKQTSGTTGVAYLGVVWYDSAKTLLTASGATGWPSNGTGSYFGIYGSILPTSWTRYSADFGPNETYKQHPSAKFVRLIAYLNYTNIVGSVCSVGQFALMRKTAGEIIVDGTVSASKLVANSITAGQIAAGAIGAEEIAAGAVTTKALLVTGNNFIANSDFSTGDYSNWRVWAAPSNQAIVPSTDVSVPAGAPARYVCKFYYTSASVSIATFAAVSAYGDAGASQDGFDVLPGNVYDVRIYGAKSSDYVASSTRVYAYFWKDDGTYTTNLLPINFTPTTTWAEYTGSFTAPAGAIKCWMYVISNTVTAGSFFWTRLRVKERVNADLIVDGSIVAAKIAANTITASQIAADTITSAQIAANAITSSELAANSVIAGKINAAAVSTNELAANAVTAAKIAANTITAAQVAAGSLTSNEIDTRNLTIKDASGNVIFGSGSTVNASSYMTPASGWVNTNITVNADGTLSGAGSGQVTITGLGYSADNDLVNGSGCTIAGGKVTKTGGVSGTWDSSVYSKTAFKGGAFASAVVDATGKSLFFGLNTDPTTDNSYLSIDYAWYVDGVNAHVRINGATNVYDDGAYAAGDAFGVMYDGSRVVFLKNGVVKYTHTSSVTADLTMYFDTSFATSSGSISGIRFGAISNNAWSAIGGSGKPDDNATVGAVTGTNLVDPQGYQITNTHLQQNLLDPSRWAVGVDGWTAYGNVASSGNNTQPVVTVCDGTSDTVWQAVSLSGSTSWMGGPNSRQVTIDPTKTYRYVIPFRRQTSSTDSHLIYVGVTQSHTTVDTVNTTTANTNAYFGGFTLSGLTQDKWYLCVGYIYPAGSTGNSATNGGYYDCDTGIKIGSITNFNWHAGVTDVGFRHGLYKSTAATVTGIIAQFGKPLFQVVDGSEADISEFFAPTAFPSASNPITSSNISTYISGAAIGTAQIGTLNASVITAGTITTDRLEVNAVNILARAAASSGFVNSWLANVDTESKTLSGPTINALANKKLETTGHISIAIEFPAAASSVAYVGIVVDAYFTYTGAPAAPTLFPAGPNAREYGMSDIRPVTSFSPPSSVNNVKGAYLTVPFKAYVTPTADVTATPVVRYTVYYLSSTLTPVTTPVFSAPFSNTESYSRAEFSTWVTKV